MALGRLITVKDAVSAASMEIGITQQPVTMAVGSLDQDIVQMTALLSAVAGEILMDEPYEETLGDGFWLQTPGGELARFPQNDDDLILFDARLAVNGIKWRFLASKGLEYGEQQRDFTVRLNKLAGRANAKVLDLYDEEGREQ
jgi:hypothetical protein